MCCPDCQDPADPAARYCEACGAALFEISRSPAGRTPAPGMASSRSDQYRALVVDADLACASDPGLRYPMNQDAARVARRADGNAVLVVADGVSCSWRGELAADLAARIVLEQLLADAGAGGASSALCAAVAAADQAVKSRLPRSPRADLDDPATTVVAALQDGPYWHLAWVGDSRAYRVDGVGESALTRDDSWLEEALRTGLFDAAAARADARAGAITQCLGMADESPLIHTLCVPADPGTWLLLCTDGLWSHLPAPGDLAGAAAALDQAPALVLCRDLIARANARGGRDNITVALGRLRAPPDLPRWAEP